MPLTNGRHLETRRIMSLLFTALIVGMGACSDPTSPGAGLSREEFGVSITPETPTIDVGSRMKLQSRQGGKAYAGAVTWSVEDTDVATIDGEGILIGRYPGMTRVTASSGGTRASATLKVQKPTGPLRLVPDPAQAAMVIGDPLTFSGEVRKGNGKLVTTENMSWISENPDIVSISETGEAKALAAGTATLVVSWEDLQAPVTVTVTDAAPPQLALIVDPGITTMAVGDTASLTGEVVAEDGSLVSTAVSWSSTNTSIVTVDGRGHIKGTGQGEARVLARWQDIEQAATVTVSGTAPSTPAPPVASDGEFVVYPNDQIAFILGPQLKSGSTANPWPWFDENAIESGKRHGPVFEDNPAERSYYDQGRVQYLNYYRTGDAEFLKYARDITDYWYEHVKPLGTNIAPRSAAVSGLMLRALDGRPEMWDWILPWVNHHMHVWLEARLDYETLHYGLRDGGYALYYGSLVAAVHPDAAVRSEYKARVLTVARDYYARLQYSDGSWRWGDSQATITGKFMQPFMVGLMLEGLVAVHQLTGDAVVANAIMKSAENLYAVGYRLDELVPGVADTNWRGMWYFVYGNECMPGQPPAPQCGAQELRGGWDTNSIRDVRQLNPTTVHAFGYAYKISGDTRYLAWGDEIFASTFGKGRGPLADDFYGLADYQAKQYNQSYRSAGTYLARRVGQ